MKAKILAKMCRKEASLTLRECQYALWHAFQHISESFCGSAQVCVSHACMYMLAAQMMIAMKSNEVKNTNTHTHA